MAEELELKLTLLFNETLHDNGGDWQYAAATATVSPAGPFGDHAVITATKRTNSSATFPSPASILTGTAQFAGSPPMHMTFQGVHDLQTNDESGSISAASPKFAGYVGGQFAFDAGAGILTISPA